MTETRHSPMPPMAPPAPLSASERPLSSKEMQDGRTDEERRRAVQEKARVFGAKAALNIETDRHAKGYRTLTIEAARAIGTRQYDWETKIQFQLTARELPQFVAMLSGYGGADHMLEFVGHGEAHDKNMRLIDRGGHMVVTVQQKAMRVSVRVELADTFQIIALGLKMLMENHAHLDSQTVLHMCRRSLVTVPVPSAN